METDVNWRGWEKDSEGQTGKRETESEEESRMLAHKNEREKQRRGARVKNFFKSGKNKQHSSRSIKDIKSLLSRIPDKYAYERDF